MARRLVYVALFAFACGCSSHGTSCERVAERAREIHPAAYNLTLAHCKTNHWPDSTRACAAAAKTRTEFTACAGAHLVVEVAQEPPRPPEPVPLDNSSIVLDLHADGTLFIADKRVEGVELDKLLAAAAVRRPQPHVVLRADDAAPTERVNDVVNRAKAAGLEQLSFATSGEHATTRVLRLAPP